MTSPFDTDCGMFWKPARHGVWNIRPDVVLRESTGDMGKTLPVIDTKWQVPSTTSRKQPTGDGPLGPAALALGTPLGLAQRLVQGGRS